MDRTIELKGKVEAEQGREVCLAHISSDDWKCVVKSTRVECEQIKY